MADQDVIIEIGSSNMAGFQANLYDVPVADYARWTSQVTPTALSARPYTFAVPGVRVWTPRRPYSLNAQRAVTVGGGGVTLTYGGSAIAAPAATVDMWMFIRSGTGRGNLRRIFGVAGQDLTAPVAFSPSVAVGDTLVVLQDSHTLHSLSADGLTITKVAGTTPNFSSSDIGRFVSFFDSAPGGETTRKIVKQTDDTLTFDQPLTSFPTTGIPSVVTFDGAAERVNLVAHGLSAGQAVVFEGGTPPVEVVPGTVYYVSAAGILADTFELSTTLALALVGTSFTLTGNGTGTTTVKALGAITGANGFCVLSGANAAHALATMQPPNAVLQDLTFTLDDVSPVFLTGLDYTNWDFTPFASPRALSADPTINSVAELSFHVKSKTSRPLVVLELGVSASMISTFPIAVGTTTTLVGPLHDITSLDFHPASPDGIYEILTAAITSMRALIEAEGNTMKVRGIFINLFDNDGVDFQRIARLGSNTRLLRDSLRTFLEDASVPWIMSGPSAYGGGPGSATQDRIYEHLFAIAAADPYSGVVDTRVGYTYSEDNFHFSAFSQIRLGQDFFRVWEPIHDRIVEDSAAFQSFSLEVCNMALGYLGKGTRVFSLDTTQDLSAEAALCAQFFPVAFKDVLERHTWAFTTRTAALIAATKDEVRTDWAFAYMVPGDMDAPIEIMRPGHVQTSSGEIPPWLLAPPNDLLPASDPPPFAVEKNDEGDRVLYTNVESAVLRYSVKINSRSIVPNSFKKAVAQQLAAEMVGSIVQGEAGMARRREHEALSRLMFGEAASLDANRQQKQAPPQRMPWNRL